MWYWEGGREGDTPVRISLKDVHGEPTLEQLLAGAAACGTRTREKQFLSCSSTASLLSPAWESWGLCWPWNTLSTCSLSTIHGDVYGGMCWMFSVFLSFMHYLRGRKHERGPCVLCISSIEGCWIYTRADRWAQGTLGLLPLLTAPQPAWCLALVWLLMEKGFASHSFDCWGTGISITDLTVLQTVSVPWSWLEMTAPHIKKRQRKSPTKNSMQSHS